MLKAEFQNVSWLRKAYGEWYGSSQGCLCTQGYTPCSTASTGTSVSSLHCSWDIITMSSCSHSIKKLETWMNLKFICHDITINGLLILKRQYILEKGASWSPLRTFLLLLLPCGREGSSLIELATSHNNIIFVLHSCWCCSACSEPV